MSEQHLCYRWYDKEYLSARLGAGGQERHERDCGGAGGSAVGCARSAVGLGYSRRTCCGTCSAPPPAGRGAGGTVRDGVSTPARRHAHSCARHTTPAPEERHCALSQPSLNEHTARHPPLGTNSTREYCCCDGPRRLHSRATHR